MDRSRLNQLLDFIKERPEDSFLCFAIAKEYESLGELDNALIHYRNLLERDPDYLGLYYHLAKLYETIEENLLAKETYESGIAIAKKQADFHALSELNNAYTNLKLILEN